MKFKSNLSTKECVAFLKEKLPNENNKWKRLSKNCDEKSCYRSFTNEEMEVVVIESKDGLEIEENDIEIIFSEEFILSENQCLEILNNQILLSPNWKFLNEENHDNYFACTFELIDNNIKMFTLVNDKDGVKIFDVSGGASYSSELDEYVKSKQKDSKSELLMSQINKISPHYFFEIEDSIEDEFPTVMLVRKSFFLQEKCLDDQERGEFLNEFGFSDIMEAVMEYNGDIKEGRKILLSLGLEEKKLGLEL